jgi:nucleoside-diphosphate-sugar epimerase
VRELGLPCHTAAHPCAGFIGSHVVRTFLHDGFRVRLPARTQEKGDKFVKHFSEYADKLEVVVIPDALREGAYDEAVKGERR